MPKLVLEKRKEYVINRYKELKNPRALANELGCRDTTVYRFLKRHNIEKTELIRKKIDSKNYYKYFINNNYFENIDNEHKAYWLGFLFADGCVHRTKEGRLNLLLGLHERDKDHMEKFQYDISSTYKICKAQKNCVRVSYRSTKLCEDLIKLGCIPRKTFNLKFPNLREDLVHDFLRGYFDGDGCICIDKRTGANVCEFDGQTEFLIGVNKILNSLGIFQKISINNKNCYRIRMQSKNDINILYHYLYDNSTVYMDRKFKKFDKEKMI